MNKGRAKTSLKKYTSPFIVRFACEKELETEQNCNILTPTLMAISIVLLVLQGCPTGGPGAQLSAGWWLSLPHLVSNSFGLQLTDFLSTPSYIIVQLPTQSLEWHVWSSSSGNNCHAVHRSLSFGALVWVYHGILPCPIFFSQARLRDFFS